jgi:hypothetical protein
LTPTPSSTAWSIAAVLSDVSQPSASLPVQHTLQAAMRARGAMPEMRLTPRSLPSISGSTPKLPAAVEAVWLPWPSSSRGDRWEPVARLAVPKPET